MPHSKKETKIIISAGGTGGHMTPAQALAADLLSRGYDVEVITDQRGARFKPIFGDVPFHVLRAGTLGAGIRGKVGGLFNLAIGIFQASALLKRLKPSVVIGFGGYPSFPAVYAAQRQKIPTVIHEQNAIIGKANLMLADKAERIALSLPLMRGLDADQQVRTVITGNPVRPSIAALYSKPYPKLEANGELRILIMGGSLGARVFSRVIPDALVQLSPDYKKRLHIVQQCRAEDLEAARKAYAENGIKADLATFFDDVDDQLEKAHLFIGRSGASTVAEIAAAGRPAIFVPYPHHKDQQQKMNAESLADAGGAWLMTESGFSADTLLARIEAFLQNPETLFRAAEKARSCGKPDAARKLGNLVIALTSGW